MGVLTEPSQGGFLSVKITVPIAYAYLSHSFLPSLPRLLPPTTSPALLAAWAS